MAYETIVAVYDNADQAEAAVKALKAGGFADADISIFDEDRLASAKKAVEEAGLWSPCLATICTSMKLRSTVRQSRRAASSFLPALWMMKSPTPPQSSIFIDRLTCTIAR